MTRPSTSDDLLRGPADDSRPSLVARVAAALRDGEYCVVALDPIPAGAALMEIEGPFVDKPSRYSVQVGKDAHVEPPSDLVQGDEPERYRWRFLNHSCNPNAMIVGRRLFALRAIDAGEQVTFDYNTTEFDMASPFICRCGCCGGRTVWGFSHLSAEEQRALAPRLADHLRVLLPPAATRRADDEATR